MKKFILLSFTLIFIGCQSNTFTKRLPKATQGVIDLTNWDFNKQGQLRLDGEWEFYWSQLLEPTDFQGDINLEKEWIAVPKPWNVVDTAYSAKGYGTFRLKIIAPNYRQLSLRVTEIRDAYKLWANEMLIVEHGQVGQNKENTTPRVDSRIMTIPVENGVVNLTFQVSNFRSTKGGIIRKSFMIGTEAQIQKKQYKSIANVLFLCGCYLIIGIYHLLFYQMRRRNRGALYFGVLCFLTGIRVLTTSDKLMIYWMDISTEFNSKLAYLSIYLAIPFFFMYLRTFFPREISKRAIRVVCYWSWALAAFIIVAPNEMSPLTNRPFQLLILASTIYLVYQLFIVLKKRRRGGVLLTVGMLIVMLSAWNDLFYEEGGVFSGFLFPFGILVFMMLQTFFLARIFASNMDSIRKLSETFRKFVPEQFLRRLDKNEKNEIPIGIAEEELLTISFSDIRSFSKISEQMSSQELLIFLNGFFEKMDEPIRKNYGFIDKYIGDSIMSVFDRRVDDNNIHALDAVQAAITMHQVQQAYQASNQNSIPIQFGIGIHTGRVILGTVGSDKRMDSTVIGDSVNLASRLESLTKYYNAQIIISETTKNLIHSDDFMIRQLDRVVVKGKSNIVSIYEVFNANSFEVQKKKIASLPIFEKGISCFYEQKWEQAEKYFYQCLEKYPEDNVVKMYLERCEFYRMTPPSEEWKGEHVYQIK